VTEGVRVYVDLDDVICETALRLAELAETQFGRRIPFEEIREFDLASSFGLSAREHAALMEAAHAPEVLLSFREVPGAVETIRRWAAKGRRICVVTGRPPDTADISRAWLERHGVPVAELIFVDKYGRHDGAAAGCRSLTLEQLAGQRFDAAVEDEPRTADFLARRLGAPVAVLRRPWNACARFSADAREAIVRCRDWADIAARWP